MRKLIICFLLLNSLIAFSAGISSNPMTIKVDTRSKLFEIILPSNPTTGYQWSVTHYDKTILKLTGSQYQAPKSKLMGAGGEMRFIFSRVKGITYPKSTTMLFRYARSWEHDRGVIKKVVVKF